MPLSVGTVTAPPPVAPPVIPPERLRLMWVAPDGGVHELTSPNLTGINALASNLLGASNLVETTTDDNPRGGVTVRHQQALGRLMILPVHVRGRSQAEFLERWRGLEDAFTQTQDLGPGTLQVRRPDGSRREIQCWYESGWDGQPEHGVGVNWDNAVLTLLTESPFWRDPTLVRVTRAFAEPVDYFDPYASISSGQVLGENTVLNDGQVLAWPTWRLTGPLSLFTATLTDAGEEFSFDPDWDGDGPLLAGQTATIVTDPVQVRGPAGEVWTGAINFPTGVLWALRRGTNQVTFTAAGADVGTQVQLEFHRRYRTG